MLNSGRHIQYESETPLTNLYLWMLGRMGVRQRSFADSTRPLVGLEA